MEKYIKQCKMLAEEFCRYQRVLIVIGEKTEKLVCVLSLGYGMTQGVEHKSKPLKAVCRTDGLMPDWFKAGMAAGLLAPTAMNQQRFLFTLLGDTVKAEAKGGFYSKVDLGIAKYHFEIGAGRSSFRWQE